MIGWQGKLTFGLLFGVVFTPLFMNGETSPKIYKIGCWVSFDQVTKFCVFAPKWYVCDIASVGILNSGYTNTFFCKMNCFSLKNVLLYVECKSHSSTRNISSLGYLCMHTGASCPILYYYTIMQQCVTSKVCVGMFGWNSVKKWYSTILAWSSGLFSQINPFQVVYCIIDIALLKKLEVASNWLINILGISQIS